MKSNNTTGNPYHDEEGKFTTKNENGQKVDSSTKFTFKSGVDLKSALQNFQTQKQAQTPTTIVQDYATPLTMPTTLQEAEQQGARLVGSSNVVGYEVDTDVRVAHEFNKALQDVIKDFPELFKDDQLYAYGTRIIRPVQMDKATSIATDKAGIDKILSTPVYVSKMADLQLDKDSIIRIMTSTINKIRKQFEQKGTDKGVGGFTAMHDLDQRRHVLSVHNMIKLNKFYSRDIAKWEKYPKSAVATRHFLPIGDKNGAYMVGTHELGHHVFEKIVSLCSKEEVDNINQIIDRHNVKKLYAQGEISGYATTSRHEHVAEAFANVYCMGNQATSHNKKLYNYIKTIYNRLYGKAGN